MRYRIKDWDKFFENNKSRMVDQCSFVCMPNKQDGMGLTRILSLEDGAGIYGIWCLIVGACSRQRKPRQGYLTDDGTAEGNPWDAADLANRWRQPIGLVEKAMEVLSSSKIGWLELDSTEVLDCCQQSAFERAPKEGKERTEGTNGKKEGRVQADEPPSLPLGQNGEPITAMKIDPPRKVPETDFHQFIAHFKAGWERRHKVEFVFVGGKDGKHVKRVLEIAKNLEFARLIADTYLADSSDFVLNKFHPLAILASQISTYAAKAAKKRNNGNELDQMRIVRAS